MPGSVHATLSKGCHKLIRDGARLVETAADVLCDMRMLADGEAGARPALDDSFVDRVLDAMGDDPPGPSCWRRACASRRRVAGAVAGAGTGRPARAFAGWNVSTLARMSGSPLLVR
jgi:hypothetical protein